MAIKKIQNLSNPSRNGDKFKVTWKNQKDAGADGIKLKWTLDNVKVKDTHHEEKASGKTATSDETSIFKKKDYYPKTAKKLKAVKVSVWGYKGRSEADKVESSKEVTVPGKPPAPSLSYDEGTGMVTASFAAAPDSGFAIRTDTVWSLSAASNTAANGYAASGAFAGDSSAATYDPAQATSLLYDQYIKVSASAYGRGPRGDGAASGASLVIAHPAVPSIRGAVTVSGGIGNQLVVVPVAVNWGEYHPTEKVQLQRLKNASASATPVSVSQSPDWQDVSGAEDNASCSGLLDSVADGMSSKGKYTWYRIKATARGYTQYSQAVRADVMFIPAPTAEDDEVAIVSVEPLEDGTTLKVLLGWNNDDSTGSELAWSDSPFAIYSNEGPKSMEVEWYDSDKPTDYDNGATAYITGLNEGERYYLSARRYLDSEDLPERSLGYWSDTIPAVPVSTPQSVMAYLPEYIVDGEDVQVSWSMVSEVPQVQYMVYAKREGEWVAVAGAETSRRACVLPAEVYDGMDRLEVCVEVTTGGSWARSENATAAVTARPTVQASVTMAAATPDDQADYDAEKAKLEYQDVYSASGASVSVTTSIPCDAIVRVVAFGGKSTLPDGDAVQASGDVVFSRRVYSEEFENLSATVAIDGGIDLYDHCNYYVSVQAVDTATGLYSEAVEIPFSVLWAHQAGEPAASVSVADGEAAITVTLPDGAAGTDTAEVYRKSGELYQLVARGVRNGTVNDAYPPATDDGEGLHYRVAVVTEDGDRYWNDEATYSMRLDAARIDWNGAEGAESVELPYNLSFTNAVEKLFEARQHIDGTTTGYWGHGSKATVQVSADTLKRDADTLSKLERLARHEGACFVRLPNGLAFPADVQVSGVSFGPGGVVGVSLNITEVGMTDEWMAQQ